MLQAASGSSFLFNITNAHFDSALLHLSARLTHPYFAMRACTRPPRFRSAPSQCSFDSPVLRYEGMHPPTSIPLCFFSVLVCILTQYNKRTILPASRFNRPSVILCPHSLFVHVCEFFCLIGSDAGIDDFLDVAVHNLV